MNNSESLIREASQVGEGHAQSRSFTASTLDHVFKTLLSAAAISLFFFIWSDYVDKQPDLNGTWYFTSTTLDTSLIKYRGMRVTYEVNLVQNGLHLSGIGEKLYDQQKGATQPHEYAGKDRTQIVWLEADINHNYLSRDTLALTYREAGSLRTTSTFMRLVRYNDQSMSGTFSSTAADSKGSVEWRRTPNP